MEPTLADKATNRRLEPLQEWKSHSCSRNHRYDRTVRIFESKGSLRTCTANWERLKLSIPAASLLGIHFALSLFYR